jgi:multidrug resistance efflux pump
MNIGAIIVLAAVISGPADSQQPATHIQSAHIFYLEQALVPAKIAGPVVHVEVKVGDLIQKNQPLAKIDDEQLLLAKTAAELERDVAQERAADEIDIEYAIASHALAETELQTSHSVNASTPGAIRQSDINKQRLAEHRARLQIESSRKEQRIAKKNALISDASVTAADYAIQRCHVVSPFDGRVVEVFRRNSEWVDVGQPVMHVVRLDKLRVDGLVDVDLFDLHELEGRAVQVNVSLARGRVESFIGQVVFVNPQVQAGNKYRLQAEIENRRENGQWLLGPGHAAEIFIY